MIGTGRAVDVVVIPADLERHGRSPALLLKKPVCQTRLGGSAWPAPPCEPRAAAGEWYVLRGGFRGDGGCRSDAGELRLYGAQALS
jgi:hypothetical protein